ncbi:hypothetical protein HYFRA_00002083 [Hymenoscyphus fraxineus]|uniref:non-specific serine/threonine protein kinase n=1 Tax=Hymenoscyphus fraxineus TaxID=746836 RepID=A0A9N9KJV6_9HELO|nr:hypothetical protein HYFRA_00002083 [Hymenoscyphus fraxineus]
MPAIFTAPPPSTAAPTFNQIKYQQHHHHHHHDPLSPSHDPTSPHQLPKLQTDNSSFSSADTSLTSSPESRPIDLRSPIPEEDEEDETSSEAANEPVTPTDSQHPYSFPDRMNGMKPPEHINSFDLSRSQPPPLILNTTPTPPTSTPTSENKPPSIRSTDQPTKTSPPKRPGSSSKDSGIKQKMSGFFRRSLSHGANAHDVVPVPQLQIENNALSGSDPNLSKEQRRRLSANNSPSTTRSNSPPSPASPGDTSNMKSQPQAQLQVCEPTKDEFFQNRKKNRSSTGLGHGIRDRFSRKSSHNDKATEHEQRDRATSVDLDPSIQNCDGDANAKLPERAIWALPAETGIGLKSRRMSLSLPDDFTVDVADLYSEFQDQSKMVGKRGKSIGKGATSKVKLMYRKGFPGEVFAVKEFRGKSSNEKAEDYEQKVKSEYSIAKSVHHPNIVETFRLCVYAGKWNHVMEYCDQGDLFNLVSQKYLSRPERLSDRLCLFKQLVQGINYLHSNGIAHRDIKLENLLITKESKLKITDFGVSEVFDGIHPGLRAAAGQCGKSMGEARLCAPGMCGSPPYVAPEVLAKQGEYDPRPLDVWGAAVVMLCLCANGCLWTEAREGSSPLYDDLVRGWTKWNAKHPEGEVPNISETDYPHVAFFDQHINPPALRRILLTMLNPEPSRRATMATIAKNRWLKNVECCQIDSYDDPTTTVDATKLRSCSKSITKVVSHNHLPPQQNFGHKFVRLPGSTDM